MWTLYSNQPESKDILEIVPKGWYAILVIHRCKTPLIKHNMVFMSFPQMPVLAFRLIISEVKLLSRVRLFATPWTVAYQAPPSMGFSRQEYWSGLPFPSPGDPPNPGIKPGSPALQTDTLPSEPPEKPLN